MRRVWLALGFTPPARAACGLYMREKRVMTREPVSYAEWKVDDDQRRREDRLDRMVAAVYPTLYAVDRQPEMRAGMIVEQAQCLLEAVDAQIAREAQPETKETP